MEESLPPEELKAEVELDPEKSRKIILESIDFLDRRLKKISCRKEILSEELEYALRLESFSTDLKKEYAKRLVESDRSIYKRLGIDIESPKSTQAVSTYPFKGVIAFGVLMIILGAFVLWPFDIPLTIRYVFGAGLILVGIGVLLGMIAHSRMSSS